MNFFEKNFLKFFFKIFLIYFLGLVESALVQLMKN